MSKSAVIESVEVPSSVRKNIIGKVSSGEISRKRLAQKIGISEPTLYKILGSKTARVSVKTMELLHKMDEKPAVQRPQPFPSDSIMGQNFNRKQDAEKLLNAVDTVMKTDAKDEIKVFIVTKMMG